MPKSPSDWFKTVAVTLLLSLLAFASAYGARSQALTDHERRLSTVESQYVPKDEYQQILVQHMKMMEKMDQIAEELKAFRIEQARLHGAHQ